jgi:glycerate dehydrogenase
MNVLGYDPYLSPERAEELGITLVSLDELLRRSDYITIHVPKSNDTVNLINRESFAKMKDGVYIINCARGGLVNEQDLAEALKSGRIAGAAVDVVSAEPVRPENPLLEADNCLITPHIAWATATARQNLMNTTVTNIKAFMAGRPVNVVNSGFLR